MTKVINILNPIIYSLNQLLFLLAFYFAIVFLIGIESRPVILLMSAVVNSIVIIITDKSFRKFKLSEKLNKILLTTIYFSMIIVSSYLIEKKISVALILNIFILFYGALAFLKYHYDVGQLAFNIEKRLKIKFLASVVYLLLLRSYLQQETDIFVMALGYLICHFIICVVIMGQIRLAQVYSNSYIGQTPNDMLNGYSNSKNIEADISNSIKMNFLLLITVIILILFIALQGANALQSPLIGFFYKMYSIIVAGLQWTLTGVVYILYFTFGSLIKFLMKRFGAKTDFDFSSEGDFEDVKIEPIEDTAKALESLSQILGTVIVVVLIAVILYKFYKIINKINSEQREYTEEKEFVFSLKDSLGEMSKKVKRLLENIKTRDNKSTSPLRKIYFQSVTLLKDKGMEIEKFDTSISIFKKSTHKFQNIENQFQYITEQYNNVRYGEEQEIEIENSKYAYEYIKQNLSNKNRGDIDGTKDHIVKE